MHPYANAPFPFDALPDAAQYAAKEILLNTAAPDNVVGTCALSAMSIATSLSFNVRLPHGPVRAPTLYMVVITESGDRKSTVEKLVMQPLYELHEELANAAQKQRSLLRDERDIKVAVRKRYIADIAKAETNGSSSETLRAALKQVGHTDREYKTATGLIVGNTTPAAFMKTIGGSHRFAAILSDEGGAVLNGPLYSDLSLLNSAWDYVPLLGRERARESTFAHFPRVCIYVAVQPGVWRKFDAKRGQAVLTSGFRARTLIASAHSKQGFRHAPAMGLVFERLGDFHECVQQLIGPYRRAMLSNESLQFTPLELEPRAAQLVHLAVQTLEPLLAQGGPLHDCRDFVSKFGEHVCRIAASIHAFRTQGYSNLISPDTVERAIAVAQWFGSETQLVYAPSGPLSQMADEAEKLLGYVSRQYWNQNAIATVTEVGRNGPIRPKARVQECLGYLYTAGKISIVRHDRFGDVINPPLQRSIYCIPGELSGSGRV